MKKYIQLIRNNKLISIMIFISISFFICGMLELITNSLALKEYFYKLDWNEAKQNIDTLEKAAINIKAGDFTNMIISFSIFSSLIVMFTCLFNIIGCLYKKIEFITISIGILIILFSLSFFVYDIGGKAIICIYFVLTLMTYIKQRTQIK